MPPQFPPPSRLLHAALLLCACLLTSGCGHNEKSKSFMDPYRRGDFAQAADASAKVASDAPSQDRLLFMLEEASVMRAAGRLKESDKLFENAFETVQRMGSPDYISVSQEMASAVLNPTVITYRGTSYDRVMLVTYKALNALQQGNFEAARVELKRAQFFQQDTQERFAKEIEKQRKAVAGAADKEGKSKGTSYDADRAMNQPGVKSDLNAQYGQMRQQFKPYASYLNPFSQLLTGIFFLARATDPSDMDQARYCFRSVIGMVGSNPYLDQDLKAAESGQSPEDITYVIVESGIGPWRDQFKITIPAFMKEVPAIAVSFPILRTTPGGPSSAVAIADGKEYPVVDICNMDSIVSREFDDTLDLIIFRTIAGTGTKAAITFAINQSLRNQNQTVQIIGLIGTSLYAYASNNADQRTWLTLPKHFYYCRFPSPKDRTVRLWNTPRGLTVKLSDAKVNVVYVKAVSDMAPATVWEFKLK
jgi:uncharacterized protein